jgi:UDPglucose 6-dehydrogenase
VAVVYEPVLTEQGEREFFSSKVIDDLTQLKQISNVIVANCMMLRVKPIRVIYLIVISLDVLIFFYFI